MITTTRPPDPLTVAQLIESLRSLPPDLTVRFWDRHGVEYGITGAVHSKDVDTVYLLYGSNVSRLLGRAWVWRRAMKVRIIKDRRELARLRAAEKALSNLMRHFQ